MPLALDASFYVLQGFWTNWSKGSVTGATLTLTASNATVLTAVLAIFVQVSGSQLWNALQLILHHRRSSKKPNDGLYYQQQAVLRNSTSDIGTISQLLRVAWAWRRSTKRPWMRSLSLMLWALLHFAFFVLAGIFSSPLVDAGDETLSRSPYCGKFSDSFIISIGNFSSTGEPSAGDVDLQAYISSRRQLSQEYVQSCYGDAVAASSSYCGSYKKRQLSWTSNKTETCPFSPSVCLSTSPTVTYDTGYIHSERDLGLNAPSQDRVLYRRVTQCAILDDSEYISDWKNISSSDGKPPKLVVDAYYGPNVIADRNATFSFSDFSDYYSWDQVSDENPYQLHSESCVAGDLDSSDFIPIPELVRTDADVTLAFLSFSKSYDSPVDDPWFAAHRAGIFPSRDSDAVNTTIFLRDRPVTTLGCAEQHQFCTGGEKSGSPPSCTPMMGYEQIWANSSGIDTLKLNPRQNVTYLRILQAAIDSNIHNLLFYLSQRDMPLLARRKILKFVGSPLPEDQWQTETDYWQSLSMAQMQRATVEYGTGQFAPNTDDIALADNAEKKWLCGNLVVRGTSFRSFALLPLVLIFLIGLLIVLFGVLVENLAKACQEKWNIGALGVDIWDKTSLFELQRQLYEEMGVSPWRPTGNGVPVTEHFNKHMMDLVEERRRCQQQKKAPSVESIEQAAQPKEVAEVAEILSNDPAPKIVIRPSSSVHRISGIFLLDSSLGPWIESTYDRLRGIEYPERLT